MAPVMFRISNARSGGLRLMMILYQSVLDANFSFCKRLVGFDVFFTFYGSTSSLDACVFSNTTPFLFFASDSSGLMSSLLTTGRFRLWMHVCSEAQDLISLYDSSGFTFCTPILWRCGHVSACHVPAFLRESSCRCLYGSFELRFHFFGCCVR